MLTARLHLGYLLRLSGALPLIPLYAFMILTRNSPESSQLHVLGLMVVFNVTDMKLSSVFIVSLWRFNWIFEIYKISPPPLFFLREREKIIFTIRSCVMT